MFDRCFAVCKLQRCKEAHQVLVGEEELNIWDIHQNNIILHCILHHLKAVMGTMTIHEEKLEPCLTTVTCILFCRHDNSL